MTEIVSHLDNVIGRHVGIVPKQVVASGLGGSLKKKTPYIILFLVIIVYISPEFPHGWPERKRTL